MEHRIVTFEELISPLSKGKVMVVVECLSIEGCEHPDIMNELSEVMNLGFGSGFDDWEDLLDYGFVVLEGECKPEIVTEATLLIDYFRNEKFLAIIQADLFVDGTIQASSWTGDPEIWNITEETPKHTKSVLIRFPIEKIKRSKNTDIEK